MIAIDLMPMNAIEGVEFRRMDFHDPLAPSAACASVGGPADGVLSDMAANATGHRKTDHLRIVGLVELAADFAGEVLAPGGFFLAKVLQGGAEGELLARLKREFKHRAPRQAQGEPRRQRRALRAGDGFSGEVAAAAAEAKSPVAAASLETIANLRADVLRRSALTVGMTGETRPGGTVHERRGQGPRRRPIRPRR